MMSFFEGTGGAQEPLLNLLMSLVSVFLGAVFSSLIFRTSYL